MASALIAGLLQKNWPAGDIRVVEIDRGVRDRVERELRVAVHADLGTGIAGAQCIVLAVKPQQMHEVARALAPALGDALVVSIAAGIRHADLARWLGGHPRLVRAMPNTPALTQAGVTGLYAPATVGAADRRQAEQILRAAGVTLWVEREEEMDAVTAVSGSGPAYVFYFIEAMMQAAGELGFDEQQARTLALETFSGAAKLAAGSSEPASVLRARVTSKNGTTERALQTLDAHAVKDRIIEAIHAAARRSAELGDELGKG